MEKYTRGRWQQCQYNKKEIIAVKGWNQEATYRGVAICETEEDAEFIVEMYNRLGYGE